MVSGKITIKIFVEISLLLTLALSSEALAKVDILCSFQKNLLVNNST